MQSCAPGNLKTLKKTFFFPVKLDDKDVNDSDNELSDTEEWVEDDDLDDSENAEDDDLDDSEDAYDLNDGMAAESQGDYFNRDSLEINVDDGNDNEDPDDEGDNEDHDPDLEEQEDDQEELGPDVVSPNTDESGDDVFETDASLRQQQGRRD